MIKAFKGILKHSINLFWLRAKLIQAFRAPPPPHLFSLKLSQASWVNAVITCSHNESIVKYSWDALEPRLYSRQQHTHFHTELTALVLSHDWQWPQVQLPHAWEAILESQSISNWSWQELLVARFDLYKPPEYLLFSTLHRLLSYALLKVVVVSTRGSRGSVTTDKGRKTNKCNTRKPVNMFDLKGTEGDCSSSPYQRMIGKIGTALPPFLFSLHVLSHLMLPLCSEIQLLMCLVFNNSKKSNIRKKEIWKYFFH